MDNLTFYQERVSTPLGTMLVVTDGQGQLRALDWEELKDRMHLLMRRQYRGIAVEVRDATTMSVVTRVMQDYFDGDLAGISQLPVATGGTEFQCQVWAAVREIPFGDTISYGDLAVRIGRPKAVRAVGLANGANPIGIVVPCHRVIGADKSLTGYGGGIPRKRWLISHERNAGQRSLF